ncbi:MAG TPA: NAD(P)H-dependent oxidoreductase [Mucilaginibacter sp.]|jgi:FMN-dependent NADH-azoreductase
MKKVLVINASARGPKSQSRKLTEVFTDRLKILQDQPSITYRELGSTYVPHINEGWITAAFKPTTERSAADNEALKISDTYISELKEADVIVLGSPMYNWSIPSVLKAYIDQVVRVNETFKFNHGDLQYPYIGLLENKTFFLLVSRGEHGYEKGGYNEHLNFQDTYLKTVFGIMGITNIHVIAVNGISYGPEKAKKAIELSYQELRDLISEEFKA